MKKQTIIIFITQLFLLTVIGILLFFSLDFKINTQTAQKDDAVTICEVTATINGQEQSISLPYDFKSLPKHTYVTVTANVAPNYGDVIYLKSVYSQAKIYLNDNLIYEFGNLDNYPKFMTDPATEVDIVPISGNGQIQTLRMEFLSPSYSDTLTVHPPIMGSGDAVSKEIFCQKGISFIFSLLEIFFGILLIVTVALIIIFERHGNMFFWLGMFSFTSGLWGFGESNITVLLIKNPAILYLFAFIGLLTFCIPLLQFASHIISFKNTKPIFYMTIFITIIAIFVLSFQLFGIVPLYKSKYLFHALIPLILCALTGLTAYEWFHNKNIEAKRFLLPITMLALSAFSESFNYQIRFTYQFASLFQMGVLFFTIFSGIAGGLYIKDVIHNNNQRKQLTHEMRLMEIQMEEQKKHTLLMTENAEKTKQQRHDLRHQLMAIQTLAGAENKKLCQYIDTLIQNIPDTVKNYCENPTVNAIVSHYASICKSEKIDFTVKIVVPKESKEISDNSLCVIFGNLLENAVEACRRMNKNDRRFILVKSVMQYDILTIAVDNSFDGKVKIESGKFRSVKRNDFGIGLSSVQTIAEKYHGNVRFEPDKQVFHSSVYVRV